MPDHLQQIVRYLPYDRHRNRLDGHEEGPRHACTQCVYEGLITFEEIVREIERQDRGETLETAITPARVRSRLSDAKRRERVRAGRPARADQPADAKIVRDALAAAAMRGELPVDEEVARQLLFRVIVFVTTPGDLGETGHELPWRRLGRDLGPDGSDLDPAIVAATWSAVVRAICATPAGLEHLERNVFRHSEQLCSAGFADAPELAADAEMDPEKDRLERVLVLAVERVRAGAGAPDAVLAGLIDREFGASAPAGGLAAQLRAADPKTWRQLIARIKDDVEALQNGG